MSNVFLNNVGLYNFNKSVETGSVVGEGEAFPTIESMPSALRYPGKRIFDKDAGIMYIISYDGETALEAEEIFGDKVVINGGSVV